ncbi:hypothetical protein FHT67_002631 [Paenibacillus sp. BK720]|nr:hypothetical protein [Paenibacillus sp. BK720]
MKVRFGRADGVQVYLINENTGNAENAGGGRYEKEIPGADNAGCYGFACAGADRERFERSSGIQSANSCR